MQKEKEFYMAFWSKKDAKNRSPTLTAETVTEPPKTDSGDKRVCIELITDAGGGFYSWDGRLYQSDIVRSCIKPVQKAIGKAIAKHIRSTVTAEGDSVVKVNPEAYIRFLLEEPNPLMTGQLMQEMLAGQLALNNNAFAFIARDENGLASGLYPINARSVQKLTGSDGNVYLRFWLTQGSIVTFKYTDVIHLRDDFCDGDFFGAPIADAITPLMEIVGTIDQGLVSAVKNSAVLRWLLKYTQSLRDEDLKKKASDFAKNYLSLSSETLGVAAIDAKVEAEQIKNEEYVPNVMQSKQTAERIYAIWGTNDKIIHSSYTEDEWNAYYELRIEPIILQMQNEFSRKIFSRKERGFGNKIFFDAANLATASMSTKLGLQAMVDRGALTPNEWRAVLNLSPIPSGDTPLRRKDTGTVTEGGGADGKD